MKRPISWRAWLGLSALAFWALLACQTGSAAVAPNTATGRGAADTTPPAVLRVTSLAEVYYGGACGAPVLTVSAVARDESGPVPQAWVQYAYPGTAVAARVPLNPIGNDAFVGQIPVGQEAPQALQNGPGMLQYQVWVSDAAGNTTAAPAADGWFEVQVRSCVDSGVMGNGAAGNGAVGAVPPFLPGGSGSATGPGGNPAPPAGNAPAPPPPAGNGPAPSGPGGVAPPAAPAPPGDNPPPGGAAPAPPPGGNPGGSTYDPPIICYPDCEGNGDPGIVELPPEYQPENPPGVIVVDPNEIPPIDDPGGNPGGGNTDPGGGNTDPGGNPGGNPGQPPAFATLRVVNQSSFPVVSLKFMYVDPQTGQSTQEDVIVTVNQVIPSGGGWLEVNELVPGVTYSVMPGIGFWDASGRTISGYLAPQTVVAEPGGYHTLTITDPSDAELVTQFGTVTRYRGFVMGGSPLASYCATVEFQGNGYTFTLVHESGQTVLSDSGSWGVSRRSDMGFLTLQFQGGQTSFEGMYYYKGPEIGMLKLLDVSVPGVGMLYYIELSGNSQLCP